jgi:cellobiose-specific phosphotransferase system component IIB
MKDVSKTLKDMAIPSSKWLDPKTWQISKIVGIKEGIPAVVVSTGMLEFSTQFIENQLVKHGHTRITDIMDKQFNLVNKITDKLPTDKIDKTLDLRDLIVLSPSIALLVSALKDKTNRKKKVIQSISGFLTKAGLRFTGLNPHLLSKGSTTPQNPRVTAGTSLNASNKGVYR